MKKIITAIVFICVVIISCNSGANNNTTVSKEPNIKSYVFETKIGWGYIITVNDKVFIRQPYIPVISGVRSFKSANEAGKVAELVISKMKQNQPPTLQKEELEKLKVI